MFPFSEQWSGQPGVSVFPPTHQLDSARGKPSCDSRFGERSNQDCHGTAEVDVPALEKALKSSPVSSSKCVGAWVSGGTGRHVDRHMDHF